MATHISFFATLLIFIARVSGTCQIPIGPTPLSGTGVWVPPPDCGYPCTVMVSMVGAGGGGTDGGGGGAGNALGTF